jgi:hypothetical protein
MLFENAIADTFLDALDSGFFAERAGHQQERDVNAARAKFLERVWTRPVGQPVIGKHRVERCLPDSAAKLFCVLGDSLLDQNPSFLQRETHEVDIVRGVLQDQQAQGRRCLRNARFFQCPRPHEYLLRVFTENAAGGAA